VNDERLTRYIPPHQERDTYRQGYKAGTPPSPLLTTRQVASLLGLSPATVLRRWRAGELPGYRLASNVLRFRESEIETWLEALHSVAGPEDHAA
jgi:excisionase family DNA binding protein